MGVIQGLDTIPKEIQTKFGPLFDRFLPGWSGAGEYNFRPGATTQMASAQLGVLMQNGSHPWINNQIRVLLNVLESSSLADEVKTQRLAALVNFMGEASSPDALASNGAKTGGYIAFSSRSDPNLIAKLICLFCASRRSFQNNSRRPNSEKRSARPSSLLSEGRP